MEIIYFSGIFLCKQLRHLKSSSHCWVLLTSTDSQYLARLKEKIILFAFPKHTHPHPHPQAFWMKKSASCSFEMLRMLLVGWMFYFSSLKSKKRTYFKMEIALCEFKHILYWHYKINLQQTSGFSGFNLLDLYRNPIISFQKEHI